MHMFSEMRRIRNLRMYKEELSTGDVTGPRVQGWIAVVCRQLSFTVGEKSLTFVVHV